MDADEHRVAMGIGDGGAVVIGKVRIVIARHHDAIALPLEFDSHDSGDQKYQLFFHDSACGARAGVRAAMAWIEDHERADARGRSGRGLRGGWWLRRCLLWRTLLRRGLLLKDSGERFGARF